MFKRHSVHASIVSMLALTTLCLLSAIAIAGAPLKGVDIKLGKNPGGGAAARNSAHATETMMTGEVTQVDAKSQRFTVIANGKAVTFSSAKLKTRPKVGDTLDITYTQDAGGPPQAQQTAVVKSKSNISNN